MHLLQIALAVVPLLPGHGPVSAGGTGPVIVAVEKDESVKEKVEALKRSGVIGEIRVSGEDQVRVRVGLPFEEKTREEKIEIVKLAQGWGVAEGADVKTVVFTDIRTNADVALWDKASNIYTVN